VGSSKAGNNNALCIPKFLLIVRSIMSVDDIKSENENFSN
jgi:hypothetical protein